MTKVTSYYDAAWLLSQSFILDKTEFIEGKGTIYYFTAEQKLIDDEIKMFREHELLQSYVDGIAKLRRRLKDNKQPKKKKPAALVKVQNKITLESKPEVEILHPMED